MSYFDDYKNKISAMGISESDAMHRMAQIAIDNSIKNSPDYKTLVINGVPTHTRVLKSIGKDGFKEYKLLIPNATIPVGINIEMDSLLYLVTDSVFDSLKCKVTLTVCNSVLKWQKSDASIVTYNSIVSSVSRFKLLASNVGSTNSEEFIYAYVQRNADTDLIVPSQRFIMAGKTYQAMGIDNMSGVNSNGIGITQVSFTTCVAMDTDDFINGIADNALVNGKNKVINQNSWGSGDLW